MKSQIRKSQSKKNRNINEEIRIANRDLTVMKMRTLGKVVHELLHTFEDLVNDFENDKITEEEFNAGGNFIGRFLSSR